MYFHRLVIPVSLVISNLIAFGIQLGIFLVLLVVNMAMAGHVHPNAWVLLTPVLLVILAGYALGGGIIVCALTTRYRDLRYLVTFGVQLLMYVTPVIYPLSAVPARYRWVAATESADAGVRRIPRGFLGVGTCLGGTARR